MRYAGLGSPRVAPDPGVSLSVMPSTLIHYLVHGILVIVLLGRELHRKGYDVTVGSLRCILTKHDWQAAPGHRAGHYRYRCGRCGLSRECDD